MNPNISEGLIDIYHAFLSHNHFFPIDSLKMAFQMAVEKAAVPDTNPDLSLDIPREEIECPIEIIVARKFRENLIALGSNFEGYISKSSGYQKVISCATSKTPYPTSLGASLLDGSQATSQNTQTTSREDERQSKRFKMEDQPDINIDESYDDEAFNADWDERSFNSSAACGGTSTTEDYNELSMRVARLIKCKRIKPNVCTENLDTTFNPKMARKYDGPKNRTEERQSFRFKNTIAARVSRCKNKAYEGILKREALHSMQANITLKRKLASLRVYARFLIKLNGFDETYLEQMLEEIKKKFLCESNYPA